MFEITSEKEKEYQDQEGLNDEELLLYAIQNQQLELLLTQIHKGVDINMNSDRVSPLEKAVKIQNKEIVKLLLEHGANVILYSSDGYEVNILHKALEINSSLEIIQLLLEGNTNINAKNDDGQIPLNIGINHENVQTVHCLLTNGADVHAESSDGYSPLHHAIINYKNDDLSIIELLLEFGADVNHFSKTAYTPLFCAIKCGEIRVVEFLLQRDADLNQKYLVNGKLITPVDYAFELENLNIVKLLILYPYQKDPFLHRNPIFLAINCNNAEKLQSVLNKGHYDLNIRDFMGWTPLLQGIQKCNMDIISILLQNGADVDFKGILLNFIYTAFTPIYLAAGCYNVKILKTLLDHGANVHEESLLFGTSLLPFHKAIQNESIIMMNMLIKYGTDLTIRKYDNNTFLHCAVMFERQKSVQFLLDINIDINVENTFKKSPLCIAINHNMTTIKHLLLCHVIKLKSLDLFVSQKNLNILMEHNNCELEEYEKRCESQIIEMKAKTIHRHTDLTLYDIFKADLNQLVGFLRNNLTAKILTKKQFTRYPDFASGFKQRIGIAAEKIDIRHMCYNIIQNMAQDFEPIPEHCILNIMNYFTDVEFIRLRNKFLNFDGCFTVD